jgi:2-polyprenyl-3-methyl-5-hydroxy-6-metoxy-1,4-benzoquinol methylase
MGFAPQESTSGSMETLSCNLCGSKTYSVVFKPGIAQVNQIVRCDCCGLMYANPRQCRVDVDLIRDFDQNWVFENSTTTNKWRLDKESLQVRDYRSTKKMLSERFPEKGTLVEIGSGMGYLLKFFKEDGWNTVGIDPNAGLCMYARQNLGLTAITGTLHEAKLPAEYANVVAMMHVIEHVPDPMSVFREVYRILKPGGSFVVETPRYDTLMFKLLGRRERSLSCDGHIYFFTTETLARLARTVGFNVIRTDYVGRSMTLERLFYNFGVLSKNNNVKRRLASLSSKLQLNRLAVTLNVRDMQRAYLEKPQL